MRLGGSRALVLVAAALAPACGLVSGLDSLNRASDGVLDASTDGSSSGDAPADAPITDSAIDSAAFDARTDTGVDSGIAYVDAVLADGPIAYYRLDETSGSIVSSDVVGAPKGTFTRGVTLGTASPVTHASSNRAATFALSLGGVLSDSDLGFGNNFSFAGDAHFTIEVWVNPSTPPNGSPMHVFSKADRVSNSPVTGWNICIETVGVTPSVWVERFVASTAVITPKTPIVTGTFTHVVAVYDGSLRMYLNGTASIGVMDGRTMVAATTSAFAGSAEGTTGHGFVGQLDEIAIYDKALTAARIAAHYAAGKP